MPSRPTVKTRAHIAANIRSFLGISAAESAFSSIAVRVESRNLLKAGRNFVSIQIGDRLLFAPSRFVGYKGNDFRSHFDDDFKHGGETNLAINSILKVRSKPNAKLEAAFQALCRDLNVKADKRTRNFWPSLQDDSPLGQPEEERNKLHRSRKGQTELKTTNQLKRKGVDATTIDLAHNSIQNKLFQLLKKDYGDTVTMEDDFADIRVSHPALNALVEVKTDRSAISAIRGAIGQLLHYAFRKDVCDLKAALPQLVVAAPGPLDADAKDFIAYLGNRFALPLRYVEANASMTKSPL